MEKIKVGVVRGGIGPEHDQSINSGEYILNNLSHKYEPIDIIINKHGQWHLWGIPTTAEEALRNVDVVFNALHSFSGDENTAHHAFEKFNKPYTGSRLLGSVVSGARHIVREVVDRIGIKSPKHKVIRIDDDIESAAYEIFSTMVPPWNIRFANKVSLNNTAQASSYNELVEYIQGSDMDISPVIVEEHVHGNPIVCFVVEGMGDDESHVFSMGDDNVSEIEEYARCVHRALGLRHYSRMNFVASPKYGTYLTSVYTHPPIHDGGVLIKKLGTLDIEPPEFVDHILSLALHKK
tara:strand:+ start:1796 stop:2674 length:879 start_codon:yes stop_codon:yes gene_type:complete